MQAVVHSIGYTVLVIEGMWAVKVMLGSLTSELMRRTDEGWQAFLGLWSWLFWWAGELVSGSCESCLDDNDGTDWYRPQYSCV